jgi:hypothetical protein
LGLGLTAAPLPSIVAVMDHLAEDNNTLLYEVRARQLSSLVGLVVLTLVTATFVRLPGRTWLLRLLGSEASYEFSGAAQYVVLLSGIVCAGLAAIMRAGRHRGTLGPLQIATFWGLPLQLTLVALLLLDTLSWWGFQVSLALLAGALLAIIVTLQVRSAENNAGPARLALNAITYGLALVIFAAVYDTRLRSALSATALFASGALLSAELFRDTDTPAWRVWLLSALVGLLLGEMTWALNYIRLSTRGGAVLLLTVFYALTGLIQQHLWQRLSRRTVIEFLIAVLGGIIVTVVLS